MIIQCRKLRNLIAKCRVYKVNYMKKMISLFIVLAQQMIKFSQKIRKNLKECWLNKIKKMIIYNKVYNQKLMKKNLYRHNYQF